MPTSQRGTKKTFRANEIALIIGAIATLIAAIGGIIVPIYTSGLDKKSTLTPSSVADGKSEIECGKLSLSAIRPSAILEGNTRLYKLIGTGFCPDTNISLDRPAAVGSKIGPPSDGLPSDVGPDGTWLSVYIYVSPLPESKTINLTVTNPDGSSNSLLVGYQR